MVFNLIIKTLWNLMCLCQLSWVRIQLNSDDTLTKAERLFKENKVRHIPVIKDAEIIGMLSYTDLLLVSYVDPVDDDTNKIETIVYDMFTIEQVMTNEVLTISPDSAIRTATWILAKNEFHALLVCQDGFFCWNCY